MRVVNAYMDDRSLWFITHHLSQRIKMCQFPLIYPWHILAVLCGWYGWYPLTWLFVQWQNNLTDANIDELRGVSIPEWMTKAQCTSYNIQG